MISLKLAVAVGALAAILAPPSIAGMIYDNTFGASSGSDCVGLDIAGTPGGCKPLYDSFTVLTTGQITDIKLVLSGDSNSDGNINIALATGFPDPEYYEGITFSYDNQLSPTPSIIDIPVTFGPVVSPGQRYWILLYGSGGVDTGITTTARWSLSTDLTGIGVAGQYIANANGTFLDSSAGAYQMAVTMGPVQLPAEVPEPATALLCATAAGLLGWRSRKRAC
jgi:hypothetical protein